MKHMEKITNTFNLFVAGIATMLTYLLGAWDIPLELLLIFVTIDYISGIIYASVQKEISSNVGFKGIAKKVMIIGLVAVAYHLDRLIGNDALIFRTAVCSFYIANEGISILENASNLGLPVPQKLKDVLVQIKGKEREEVE